MPKLFHHSKGREKHRRPVGNKCQIYVQSNASTWTISSSQNMVENTNSQILSTLNAVSCRLSAIELRIDRTEEQLQGQVKSGSDADSSLNVSTTPPRKWMRTMTLGTPSSFLQTKFLKTSRHIQNAVDFRLQKLLKINEQGKFKSQRANNYQVTVK